MCDSGGCPSIDLRNQCMFPNDQGNFALPDQSADIIYTSLPYSCLRVWFGGHPNPSVYNNAADQICSNMGAPGEWIAPAYGSGQNDAYTFAQDQYSSNGGSWPDYFRSQCAPTKCGFTNSGYNVKLIPGEPSDPKDYITPSPNIAICVETDPTDVYYTMFCNKTSTYAADPTICCLNNLSCNFIDSTNNYEQRTAQRYNPLCFDSNVVQQKSAQCDWNHRRSTSSDCSTLVNNFCTSGASSIDIANKWIGQFTLKNSQNQDFTTYQSCFRKLFNFLYQDGQEFPNTNPGGECYTGYLDALKNNNLNALPTPSIQKARNAQSMLTNAVIEYLRLGGDLDLNTNSPSASIPFNQAVYQLCSQIPGLCTNFLTSYCLSKTENDLLRNPGVAKVCGCYMPSAVTALYTDTFEINPECTPYCNIPGTIPISTGVNVLGGKKCSQSTCVINNVTLNLVNSQVNNLNIGNLCGSCNTKNSAGSCNCLLTDLTFTSVQSQISSLNLSQQCSSGTCYTTTKTQNGTVVQDTVPCNEGIVEFEKNQSRDTRQILSQGGLIMAIVIGLFVVIIIIYLIFSPRTFIPGNPKVDYPASAPYIPKREYFSINNVF